MAFAFEARQFDRLESDLLSGSLAGHDATAGDRLPHEPMIDGQRVLDHVGSLRLCQLGHLVNQRELGWCKHRLDSRHTRISSDIETILLFLYSDVECADAPKE